MESSGMKQPQSLDVQKLKSSKLVNRRLHEFQQRCGEYGNTALHLAYHAALPVALNQELLHFLRINFFLEPPEQLPYTVEFEFFASGLCREIDTELYEIEPEIRNQLLEKLNREYGLPRIREIATLLWQYVEYHSPWVEDRVELERAQQLTALNFLNPAKAQEWLDAAEADISQGSRGQREWFVAMRREIEQLPEFREQIQTSESSDFDVFLAHNSLDKPQVEAVARELKQRGIKYWLDKEQIPPGSWFQDTIQQAIPNVKSAAIFIGVNSFGRWQTLELRSLVSRFIQVNIPVIPVLLPGVNNIPENLLFLKELNWVNFSQSIDEKETLDNLEWGITGKKPPSYQEDNLTSETGVDYTRLRDLLKAGNWKEADEETVKVMLIDLIEEFPCTDLRTIDQLWVKYSNGHFGFSVQKSIWESVGKDYRKFGDRVGWRKGNGRNKEWLKYLQLTFSLNAPQGHLPARGCTSGITLVRLSGSRVEEVGSSLAQRLVDCKI